MELLSFGEAAEILGVSTSTVSDLCRTRGVPVFKLRHSPRGKGVDRDGLKRIAGALGLKEPIRAEIRAVTDKEAVPA